jgi:signal transduction histidine kinase
MGPLLRRPPWRPPPDEQRRRERMLSAVRALIATLLFLASLFTPFEPNFALAPLALGLYAVFAAAVFCALRFTKGRATWVPLASHAADIAAGATLLDTGLVPAGFVVVVLALLGAAHRWGFRATIGTAVASLLLADLGHAVAAAAGGGAILPAADRVGADVALRACVLLIALAIAYTVHSYEQLRAETETVAGLIEHAEVRLGLKHSLAVVLDAIVRQFAARRALFVVHEFSTDGIFLWQGATLTGPGAAPLRVTRLDPRNFDDYLFPPSSAAWSALRHGDARDRFDVVTLDADGAPASTGPRAFPESFLSAVGSFDHLMGIGIDRPGSWTGRLFLVDPSSRDRAAGLAFGQRIVRHICPALDNVYLLHRLRSKSAANERARIARELHDGIIQSVMGVQIQLHALAPLAATRVMPLGDELYRLSGLLHEEVLNVRDMMQQMKPLELPPDRFVDTLADAVQRFQCETGINARFITQFDHVDLAPRACREVARVVQEALVNVRKHSGARNVFVRMTLADGRCRLSIEDDGCGFPFAGRLAHAELENQRHGPRVIKERVRLLGGDIAVESVPNEGARLDISIPLANTYAIAG